MLWEVLSGMRPMAFDHWVSQTLTLLNSPTFMLVRMREYHTGVKKNGLPRNDASCFRVRGAVSSLLLLYQECPLFAHQHRMPTWNIPTMLMRNDKPHLFIRWNMMTTL